MSCISVVRNSVTEELIPFLQPTIERLLFLPDFPKLCSRVLEYAAGIFGRGNYLHNHGQCSRNSNGGDLVIVDGMIRIKRSPFDFVLMDGNYCHAVSNLRQLGTPDEDPGLCRFNFSLFITFMRERMKAPGNYKIDFSHLR